MPFALLFLAGLVVGLALMARTLLRRGELSRWPSAAMVAMTILTPFVLFLAFLGLIEGGPSDGGRLVILLTALALGGFFVWTWLREFTGLMAMGDESFPGRHDKLIWVVLMVLIPPVGLAAFRMFRFGYWGTEKQLQPSSAADLI